MATINYKLANRDIQDSFNRGQMEDLRFPITQAKQGANLKPVFDEENVALLFPENDESAVAYIVAQMPHGREPDSSIEPHVHIRQSQAGQPIFVMEYKWYNFTEAVPASWSTHIMNDSTATWTTGTIANMVYNGLISGTGKGISSILLIKLYRQTGDGYSGDVLVDEFDIHYYANRFGKDVE